MWPNSRCTQCGTTSFVSTIRSKPRPPSLPELPRRLGRSMSFVEAALGAEEAPLLEPTRPSARGRDEGREALPGGGWLRVIDGGRTRPGLASARGAPKLKREPPVGQRRRAR